MPEHHLLRQHHIRDERRLFLAHASARHRHDRQLVYEAAIPRLEMPQSIQSDALSPMVEQQPADERNTPPREVSEDDLQVDEQLAHLYIEVRHIEAQHEVEVVRKKARDDTRRIQMERPHHRPEDPYRTMLREKVPIRQYCSFQRLIEPPRQHLEYPERYGVTVVFGVAALIQPPDDQPYDEQARKNDSHHFQKYEHHISDLSPITREILPIHKQ